MTKHQRSIIRSSPPVVDLLTTDQAQITIPGCSYSWHQLLEMRAALEEHLRIIERFPLRDLTATHRHSRSLYYDRTGQRELGALEHGKLTITAYSLSIDEAQDFYRLLNAILSGDEACALPFLPDIVPTPVCFHNLQKIRV
jgi:hypothetical protein